MNIMNEHNERTIDNRTHSRLMVVNLATYLMFLKVPIDTLFVFEIPPAGLNPIFLPEYS